MTLKDEYAAFEQIKSQLLAEHPGEYALICRGELVSTHQKELDAILAGYSLPVLGQFLVASIVEHEPVYRIGLPIRLNGKEE